MADLLKLVGRSIVLLLQSIALGYATQAGMTGIAKLLGGPPAQNGLGGMNGTIISINGDIENPSYGLAALATLIAAERTDILTAIANLTNGTTPVSLPVTPPSGYGSNSLADIADAVWNNPQTNLPTTPGDALLQTARSLNTTGDFDMPLYVGIFRVSRIDWPANGFYITDLSYPTFDPTGILPSDTLLSLLTRQNPDWNVGYPWGPQTYVGLDWNGVSQPHYTTLIDESGFSLLKAEVLGLGVNGVPPVWPGLANVTLGTPVAITGSDTITAAMDGVLISLTSVPARLSVYAFGSLNSYKAIGGLAFLDDNGDAEPFQTLGFTAAVFTPKILSQAAGVVVRASSGVAGTITPWTRV